MINIRQIENIESYNSFKENEKVVLIFHADWCGPCRVLDNIVTKLDITKVNDFIFGDTKHAHGIGNNNAIEIIYTGDPKEQQICGYINLIDNMYGSVICYLTDIDDNRVCRYGTLTTFGWRA